MDQTDLMVCRACGNEERASEGYPCGNCGTFVCQICTLRGVTFCATCQALEDAKTEDDDDGESPTEPAA